MSYFIWPSGRASHAFTGTLDVAGSFEHLAAR